ncbi:MAG: BatA and WFA domain-containing protein [Bacteroidales bacterium]|nr:BatA and WFA domain-containing protein [Bacteroidales bacterium]
MGFLHPWFLLLGLGALIPVIIHLFNFHRFKQVLFTNVQFLEEIFTVKKQQNKLYERLLLALRCLMVVLLALVFAQPYIKNDENKLVNASGNAVVVIVDNSFSMQNASNNGSVLDNAKAKALQVINQYSDNDVFCLLTQDTEGRHKHFVTKKTFTEFLNQVSITSASKPYSELLNTAGKLLSLRNEAGKRIFFISDFQKESFDVNNFKQDSTLTTAFLKINTENIDNVFIDSLYIGKNIFLQGQKAELKVYIRNASDTPAEKLTVKLFINGKQQNLVTCDIAAQSSAEIPMSFTVEQQGTALGRIQIMDSPVTYDDDFYFTLNAGESINVLSLNSSGGNKYLHRLFDSSSEVKLTDVNAEALDYSTLLHYNAVIINSPDRIPSGLAIQLEQLRQKGITLIVFPGKDWQEYAKAMQTMHMPFYSAKAETKIQASKIDTDNRLFDGVFTSVTDNTEMPSAEEYYKISSAAGTARQDIITYVNNDAFLSENVYQGSSAYIFSVPLDEKITDFVSQSLFVPVLWNMVLYSTVAVQPYLFMNKQTMVDLSLLNDTLSSNPVTLTDEKKSLSVIPHMHISPMHCGFTLDGQINKAGFYYINQADRVLGCIAVNYPREESVLSFLSASDIEKTLKKCGMKNYTVFNSRKTVSTYFEQSDKGTDFTLWLTLLILLSIAGETLIIYKIKNNDKLKNQVK